MISPAPEETIILTSVPGATSVPAEGLVSMTRPASTSMLDCSSVVTVKPAVSSSVCASAAVLPETSGTGTFVGVSGPVETTMFTVLPVSTMVSFAGS